MFNQIKWFFLVVNFSVNFSQVLQTQNQQNQISQIQNLQQNLNSNSRKLQGQSSNNKREVLERICPAGDFPCIRKYLARHSECKPVRGYVPDPLYRKVSIDYVPRVNVTFVQKDIEIRGLNGRVEEFYVNRETDKLVIAIEFRELTIAPEKIFFKVNRRAKEPVVALDSGFVTYGSIVFTTIIPQINNLQIDKSVTVAYVNDVNPRTSLGPGIVQNRDPVIRNTLTQYFANRATVIQELFLTEAFFYPLTFIQHRLCDFGLKLV